MKQFSWELKKDGFPKKARQQKIRIALGIIILILHLSNQLKRNNKRERK